MYASFLTSLGSFIATTPPLPVPPAPVDPTTGGAAGTPTGNSAVAGFWDNGVGLALASMLGFAAVILVIWGIIKAVGKGSSGKISEAFKIVVIYLFFAAILAAPSGITGAALDLMSTLITKILESISDAVNGA